MTPIFQRTVVAGIVLSLLNVAAGGLGYVFQLLIGRLLEPRDFAVFNAVLALIALASAPVSAFIMAVARHVAILRGLGHADQIRKLYFSFLGWFAIAAALVATFSHAAIDELQSFLRIADPRIAWIGVAILIGSGLVQMNGGFLQGLGLFGWLGWLGVAAVILKLAFCTWLCEVWTRGVTAALLGVLVSLIPLVIVTTARIVASSPFSSHRVVASRSFEMSRIVPLLAASTATTALTQFDVAIANRAFEPDVAAEFTVAAILGKAVLYLPAGLVVALFPVAVKDHSAGRCDYRLAFHSIIATLCVCGAAAGVYAVFGPRLISLLYGDKYRVAGGLLAGYSLAVLPMGVATVAQHLLIAKDQVVIAWIFFAAAIAELIVLHSWHPSPQAMIAVIAAFNVCLAVSGCLLLTAELWAGFPAEAVRNRIGNS